MSCDCIITLWTIDATVTEEIATSASSVMDFSLIAEHENAQSEEKLFLLFSRPDHRYLIFIYLPTPTL